MRVKELKITRSIKVSKNYNSIGAEISIVAEVAENEDMETAYKELSQQAKLLLLQSLSEQLELLSSVNGDTSDKIGGSLS